MSDWHIRPSDDYNAEGGPAFGHGDHHHGGHPGMSLRDWFAGQALAGMLAASNMRGPERAKDAYRVADAMLAEREKARHP